MTILTPALAAQVLRNHALNGQRIAPDVAMAVAEMVMKLQVELYDLQSACLGAKASLSIPLPDAPVAIVTALAVHVAAIHGSHVLPAPTKTVGTLPVERDEAKG